MASPALKRLVAEYQRLLADGPEGITAGPVSDCNFFEWKALIPGPEGSCFEGGLFPATLVFPHDYPLRPPSVRFDCEMFHPNVHGDGRVCISILHQPVDDPTGYESVAERWSPVQGVEKVLLSVFLMLAEPNAESAANVDAARMWREDRGSFGAVALHLAKRSHGV